MDWDHANKWLENANKDKQIIEIEPNWSWDCGLKLDYDGGLLRISSRFYQENNNIFNGSVSFYIHDDEVFIKEFSCRHIDILKKDVEEYCNKISKQIYKLCLNNIGVFIVLPEDKS